MDLRNSNPESSPYAHIQLGANDVLRMTAFYDLVLSVFGWDRVNGPVNIGPAGVYWCKAGRRWPQFVIAAPFNGQPASFGNGAQVSFLAASSEQVQEAWKRALVAGGKDEGPPGFRSRYAADFYAAYCRDPEGNKLCFVCTQDGGTDRT